MKKPVIVFLILCLLLSGCARSAPAKATDGTPWDESWITLGGVLGVAEPGHDLELRDNNEVLSASDMYLASWTIGTGSAYVNEDGDEVALYPARLDVLVYGCKDAAAAGKAVEDWTARQETVYTVHSTQTQTHNGQDYRVSTYTCTSDTNPYARGVAAFGVYGSYAVSAELNCLDSFPQEEGSILSDFLDACRYAAQKE